MMWRSRLVSQVQELSDANRALEAVCVDVFALAGEFVLFTALLNAIHEYTRFLPLLIFKKPSKRPMIETCFGSYDEPAE